MSDAKTIIVGSNTLMSRGLMYYIHAINPQTSIEQFDSLKNLSQIIQEESRVIFIDIESIQTSQAISLEKIYNKNKDCKFVALHEKSMPDKLAAYFDTALLISESEISLLEKLRQIFAPKNTDNKSESSLLSDREKEILKGVALGYTNNEIGDQLNISAHTVITHRKNISAKLGIRTIAGLAIYAALNGIITPDEMEGESFFGKFKYFE